MNQSRTKRKDTESVLQTSIFQAINLILSKDVLITCFPSGGGGKIRGARLKRMGLVAGWPDLQLLHKGKYYGIEVKTPVGKLSPAQSELHEKLKSQGAKVAVVKSEKEAMDLIYEWKLQRK
jgi:hypothetical protein